MHAKPASYQLCYIQSLHPISLLSTHSTVLQLRQILNGYNIVKLTLHLQSRKQTVFWGLNLLALLFLSLLYGDRTFYFRWVGATASYSTVCSRPQSFREMQKEFTYRPSAPTVLPHRSPQNHAGTMENEFGMFLVHLPSPKESISA